MNHGVEAQKWLESILKDWNGLDGVGVFENGFTYADLRARGIQTTPIPLSQALDYKRATSDDIIPCDASLHAYLTLGSA